MKVTSINFTVLTGLTFFVWWAVVTPIDYHWIILAFAGFCALTK